MSKHDIYMVLIRYKPDKIKNGKINCGKLNFFRDYILRFEWFSD